MSDPEQEKGGQLQTSQEETNAGAPRGVTPRRGSRFLLWLGVLVLALLAAAIGLARYVSSAEFHERARLMAIAQIERATGGRAELQAVSWNLLRLRFELRGFVLHGKEGAGEAPLLQVERVAVRLRWAPLLKGRVSLRELTALRPLAHVEVYRDGSTNLPEPKVRRVATGDETQELFRLAINHAELMQGLLQWKSEKIKLEGKAEDVDLALRYRAKDHRYDGLAKVGKVELEMPRWERLKLGAEAEFQLYRDRLQVSRLRVTEGRSWLEATGSIDSLNSPVAKFAYRAGGDLGEIARRAHYRPLRAGGVQLNGEVTYRWDGAALSSTGNAQASGVTWADDVVRLEKITGGMNYALDGERFTASSIFASALGGTAHGKMTVANAAGKPQEGKLELQVSGLELSRTLRAFTTGDLPLERLHLSGSTTGKLDVNWRGSPLDARMDGDLVVRSVVHGGELPVSAKVKATMDFRSQVATVQSVEADTAASHLSAQGWIGKNSDLLLSASTTNFRELEPMIMSWRGPRAKALPIEFGGGAKFKGALRGKLGSPAIAGHVELHDFATVLRKKDTLPDGQTTERVIRTQWALLEGDVEYSDTRESLHNATLHHGAASILVDGSVALVKGDYDATQPFSAHVRATNAELTELQAVVGKNYPLTGLVNADVRVGGTQDHLSGSGRVSLRNGTAWKQAVQAATADVNFTENRAELRNIVVKSDVMRLTGAAQINVDTSEFGFDLKGTDVRIENLQAVREHNLHVAGLASFEAKGVGTPSAPVINGRLRVQNLAVNRRVLGDLDVDAVTHGSDMTLTARSRFKAADVKLDGQIHLRDQMPMRLTADVQSANLNPLLDAFHPMPRGGATELTMHVEAKGEAKHPRDLVADMVVSRWAGTYAGITVTNDGPVHLKMANEVLTIEQFRIAGEQGARFLQVRGHVQLGGQRDINVRADGSLNLKLLETIDPGLMAGGVANLNVQVNGTIARPSMRGRVNIVNGSIAYIDFPNGLSDITGSMVFNEDRLQVQELTARTGGGLLHCGGFVTFSSSQGVGINLSASGHDIRLRYPEGLSSTADASLTLSGSMKNSVLSGEVTVTRLGVNPQFDFANYLVKGIKGAPAQKIDSPLNNVHLEVHVTSTEELEVQTSLARLSGNVDLRLRGTALRPAVLGRVNLLEGTIFFNGTKYRMERGDVTFTNPIRIDPTLDVELSARVRDYDITMGFHGPLNRLTPSYRSDPPLSSSDIISLLALGRTTEESANPAMMGTSQYQPTVSESASTAILGQALNATVSSRVQRLFGVSRLKIDPNVGQALNSGLARVTVEQQVSNKLTLTYITNLNQSAQQIIQFEYNVNKDVSIVGVRDQTGVVSIDVLLRKRKK